MSTVIADTGPGRALADARPASYWQDRHCAGAVTEPFAGSASVDLVVIGAGFTGLWSALRAARAGRQVVLLESEHVGFGATGRNGGFISDSLTHGIAHGLQMWPDDLPRLLAEGRRNLAELSADVADLGIEADLRLVGKTVVATTPTQAAGLSATAELMRHHGEDVELLDQHATRADVDSPTYLAGLRIRSGGGLVDPLALAHGLRDRVLAAGVRLHEATPVTGVGEESDHVLVTTPGGTLRANQVALATNAYRPLLRRLRRAVVPVYDHALVTEPLSPDQWSDLGWIERQGFTDSGNQFHYYRPTPDGRILWGGYDAIYYYGSNTSAAREQRDASHQLLARQFVETFPALADIRFSHRWAGLIDTTSRFTPYVGRSRSRSGRAGGGRVVFGVGFTGLGVASSRYVAGLMVDLLAGVDLDVDAYTDAPFPFPPEPLRYAAIQTTRRALAREDRTGRRGLLLRTMDRFGVGFNS